jgi:hypothetical protein
VDTLYVEFLEPGRTSLAAYTGSSTMHVSVECGGLTIAKGDTYVEQCIHGE